MIDTSARVLVVGLGSSHGDDQAGWLVIDELNRICEPVSCVIIRRASIPLDLLDWLDGVDVLHLCDACESMSPLGGFHRLNWLPELSATSCSNRASTETPILQSHRNRGSHDFGLPDVLRLADTMQVLPKQIRIWAIEGTHFQPNDALNETARSSALVVAREIARELAAHLTTNENCY